MSLDSQSDKHGESFQSWAVSASESWAGLSSREREIAHDAWSAARLADRASAGDWNRFDPALGAPAPLSHGVATIEEDHHGKEATRVLSGNSAQDRARSESPGIARQANLQDVQQESPSQAEEVAAPLSSIAPRHIHLKWGADEFELCRFDNGQWSMRIRLVDGDVAHRRYLSPMEATLLEAGFAASATRRILFESDAHCPNCGHNRDKSAVSTIKLVDGRRECQKCGALWQEISRPDGRGDAK